MSDDARANYVPLLIVGLVVTTLAAGAFLFMWLNSSTTEPSEVSAYIRAEKAAIEDRARRVIDLLMNYDSTNFEEKAEEMGAVATGSFRRQYLELVEGGIGSLLEESTVTSSGQIVEGPQISFVSATQAAAVAQVSQTTETKELPEGRTIMYVLELDFVKSGDEWMADNLDILADTSAG
jgi:hypothetical protein